MKKIVTLIALLILLTGCQISFDIDHNKEDSVEKNIVEKETHYLTLECVKRKSKETYTLTEKITAEYRDSEILNYKVNFSYNNKKDLSKIDPPQEVLEYINVDRKYIEMIEQPSNEGYEFNINFEENQDLKNITELKEYAQKAQDKITDMTSKSYTCTTQNKYTIRVYENGKLVEEKIIDKE